LSSWIPKKENWLGDKSTAQGARPTAHGKERAVEKIYTVAEVAEIMRVDAQTIKKWLGVDDPEQAVIDAQDWFRLPNNYIRIFERAVLKLQGYGSGA